jgi:hypothetical protein
MKECVYADGIESISIVDGVARLELFVFKSGEKKEGVPPEHVSVGELVMSMNGVARLYDGIGRMIEDIKKRQSSTKPSSGSENFQAS